LNKLNFLVPNLAIYLRKREGKGRECRGFGKGFGKGFLVLLNL